MRTLSRFPTVMQSAVDAVINTAEVLRHLSTTTGDLNWYILDKVQDSLRSAKVTTYATFAEAQRQPASAEAYMSSMGGPQTLAEYQALAGQIEIAATAWNTRLSAWLTTIPREQLITMIVVDRDGVVTRHVERPAFVTAPYADLLRASPELQALLAAFEAVGA